MIDIVSPQNSAIDLNSNRPTDEGMSDSSDASSRISALEKFAYLIVFILLVAIRIPIIFGQGRFWAEEGTIFFANAFHFPWYKALFTSYAGYLNLPANLAGILAKELAPMNKACLVSSGLALIFQSFPALLLCTTKEPWLQNRRALLCALLLVASLPMSHEVWLSSISSQYHLNLCVGIILALQTESGVRAILPWFILFLTPLSGPGGSFLIPLFAWRAIFERSKQRLLQTLMLTLSTAIQLLYFYQPQLRDFGIDPALMCYVFCLKHIIEPTCGMLVAIRITQHWRESFAHGDISGLVIVATPCVFLSLTALAIRSKQKPAIFFVMSGILMASVSYLGALGNRLDFLTVEIGNRYVFAPQLMIELAILCLAFTTNGFSRLCCRWLIVWLLVVALHEFFFIPPVFCSGPSWRSEVRLFEQDHSHKMLIWPYGWSVSL